MEDVFSLVVDTRQRIDRLQGYPYEQLIKQQEQGRLASRLKQWFTKSQLLELMNTLGLSDGLDDQKSKGELFVDIAGVLLDEHDGQSTEEEEGEGEGGEEEEGEEEEEQEEEGDPEEQSADEEEEEAEEPAAASVRACAVCLVAMPDRLVKPCNHLALCCKCAAQVRRERPARCPLCRAVIVKIEKVFM